MTLNPFTFYNPTTLKDALALVCQFPNSRLLAGGTILIPQLKVLKKHNSSSPEHIISLKKINELKGITETKSHIEIGSMTTLSELLDYSFTGGLKIIHQCCETLGSTPIRNMATIGGNLTGRYTWAELSSVMIALGASLLFETALGQQTITSEEFFGINAKSPGILHKIIIKKNNRLVSAFRRLGKQTKIDRPLLSLSVSAEHHEGILTNTRVVFNTGLSFAKRDAKIEHFLDGKQIKNISADEAAQQISADIVNINMTDYYKHMSRELLKQTITEIKVGATGSVAQ